MATNQKMIDKLSRNGLTQHQVKIMSALHKAGYKQSEVLDRMIHLHLKIIRSNYIYDDCGLRDEIIRLNRNSRRDDKHIPFTWYACSTNVRFLLKLKSRIMAMKMRKPIEGGKYGLKIIADGPEYSKKHMLQNNKRPKRMIDMEPRQ